MSTSLAIWEGGFWQDAAIITGIILGAYLLVLWVSMVLWTYNDIRTRSRDIASHALSVALVAAFSLPGLLLYLILRPQDNLADAYNRELEAEMLLRDLRREVACPMCARHINGEYVACPYCRYALRVPCVRCDRYLDTAWVACAYCGADRATQSAPREVASVPAGPPPAPSPAPAPSAATPHGQPMRLKLATASIDGRPEPQRRRRRSKEQAPVVETSTNGHS
jgi:hypothetical protein